MDSKVPRARVRAEAGTLNVSGPQFVVNFSGWT